MNTTRYEGPLKAGMLMQFRGREKTRVLDEEAVRYSSDLYRKMWRPVRPATPEGWALFVPDGPMPGAGIESANAGDVVTWRTNDGMYAGVGVVTGFDGSGITAKGLSGYLVGEKYPLNRDGCMRVAVVIFPAESAPEATPVPRKLAAGWSAYKGKPSYELCWVCNRPATLIHGDDVANRRCEPHAKVAGAFAETAPSVRHLDDLDKNPRLLEEMRAKAVLAPARCSCTHAVHTGICTGPSAFGHESCPCPVGRVATVPKHKRPMVGKYNRFAQDDGNVLLHMEKVSAIHGERVALLANLAREKPQPEPPRPKGGFLSARIGGGR